MLSAETSEVWRPDFHSVKFLNRLSIYAISVGLSVLILRKSIYGYAMNHKTFNLKCCGLKTSATKIDFFLRPCHANG